MIVFAMLGPFKFTHRISPPSPPSKYHIAALLHPSKTESLQQFQCSPIFHYSLVIIVQVRAMTMMLGIVWHRKDHLTSSGSTAEMMDDGRWGGVGRFQFPLSIPVLLLRSFSFGFSARLTYLCRPMFPSALMPETRDIANVKNSEPVPVNLDLVQ